MDFTDMPDDVKENLRKFIAGKGTADLDQAWETAKNELMAYLVAHNAIQTLVKGEEHNTFWQTIEKALAIVMLEVLKRHQESGDL